MVHFIIYGNQDRFRVETKIGSDVLCMASVDCFQNFAQEGRAWNCSVRGNCKMKRSMFKG